MRLFQRNSLRLILSSVILIGLVSCEPEHSKDEPLPTQYDQTIYIGSNNRIVYAFDPVTSNQKWQITVDEEVIATPLVLDNHLWVVTKRGSVYKIDKVNGQEINKRNLSGDIYATPLIHNGLLYVAAGNTLHNINTETLFSDWTFDAGSAITASPVVHEIAGVFGEYIFVATTGNRIRGYNLTVQDELVAPRQVQYAVPQAGSFQSTPFIASDSIMYVGNDNGYVYAIYMTDSTIKWEFQSGGAVKSTPICVGGNILFGSYDRHVYSIDSIGGAVRWKFKSGDRVHASPIVHSQYVYIGSYDLNFYCLDIIDGTVFWKQGAFGIVKSSAIYHNGSIYFASYDKNLYKLNALDGKQDWVRNINSQSQCSPMLDYISGVALPSVSGNYKVYGQ